MPRITVQDLEPIAATDAKVNFGELLYQTSVNQKRFVVNRQGKQVSVVLSYNEYCLLLQELETLRAAAKQA